MPFASAPVPALAFVVLSFHATGCGAGGKPHVQLSHEVALPPAVAPPSMASGGADGTYQPSEHRRHAFADSIHTTSSIGSSHRGDSGDSEDPAAQRRAQIAALAQLPPATPSSAPGAALPAPRTRTKEMLDIEVRMSIEVQNISDAAKRVRAAVAKADGDVTSDELHASAQSSVANFVIRMPLESIDAFLAGTGDLGLLRARDMNTRDIFKEYHDAGLELRNAQAALDTFEKLLGRAEKIEDVLRVENELSRVRIKIDSLKARMAWMEDRSARATISIRLFTSVPELEEIVPSATFFPGVQGGAFFDLRKDQSNGYAGGGLSMLFPRIAGSRGLVLEFNAAHAALGDKPAGEQSMYSALVGSDLYSGLMGGGRRSYLNPYLGWRAGYLQTLGNGNFALGAVIGVDLLKTKNVLFDLHVTGTALSGEGSGLHFGVAPTLGFSTAF